MLHTWNEEFVNNVHGSLWCPYVWLLYTVQDNLYSYHLSTNLYHKIFKASENKQLQLQKHSLLFFYYLFLLLLLTSTTPRPVIFSSFKYVSWSTPLHQLNELSIYVWSHWSSTLSQTWIQIHDFDMLVLHIRWVCEGYSYNAWELLFKRTFFSTGHLYI